MVGAWKERERGTEERRNGGESVCEREIGGGEGEEGGKKVERRG